MHMLDPDVFTSSDTDARRAALLLHAMAEPDRRWLLDALPASQRSLLEALLEELVAMGVPVDQAWVDDAVANAPASPHSGNAAAMVHALCEEPDRLIAQVLRCGPWPWQGELFAALPPHRRRAVQDLLQDGAESPVPQALREALLAGLRDRSGAGSVSATRPNGWQRLLARLGVRR